ncbi:MAG TPA: ATP-binding protein [Terrimicrobiaceae bacterium]
MKWLWPRTLSGQLILVMLLAVAFSQLVTLVIYRFERAKVVRNAVGEETLGRAVSAYRLAEATLASRRAETLKAIETPLTRYWITDALVSSPVEWQQQARSHLLEPTSASGKYTSSSSLFLHEPMLDQMHDEPWKVLPAGTWLLQEPIRLLALASWNGFGYSMQLDEKSWLNMVYAKPNSLMQTTLTPGYYSALVITVLIFASVALFVARRISRPLRHLTKSAERLGRGEQLEVLPEEGSDDIRSTVAAFNRMQIRLRRFLEDRTRMLAAIGHDLRTPITSLRLRTEFVADAETREKFNSTLDEMQAMAEAALSLTQSEATSETTRVVDLNALIESLCDDLADLGWNVEFQANGRLPYPCRPAALRRALSNVIENAVRYGERARVQLRSSNEGVEILVEDDGPGIPEADREKVFDPFVRLESSRNRDTGGVGLGLSIARSISRNHGGDVTLSQRSSGLCVHIRLPEARS